VLASAGYYLGSACDKIMAMSPAAEQGSIGVIAAGIDDTEALKQEGKKKITLRSSNAPRKGTDWTSKDGRENIQARLDAFEGMFLSRVSAGRGLPIDYIKANFGQGGVMMAEHPKGSDLAGTPDALSVQMIDAVAAAPVPADSFSRKQTGMHMHASSNGGKKMTLAELLASDPAAKADYDKAISAARVEGRQGVLEVAKKAAPIMASAAYPQQIKELAVKAISGEVSGETLTATIAMYDALKEGGAHASAVEETAGQKETPAQTLAKNAELIAQATALKLDPVALEAYAKDQKITYTQALTDAITAAKSKTKIDKIMAEQSAVAGGK